MKSYKKYLKTFQMGFQSAMEYRADFIFSILSGAFIVLIQCFIWIAVFSSSPGTKVYGYTFAEMISYSILAGIVTKMTATGFEWDIAADIKSGGLSKFIVQPVGYFYYRISSFLGRKVMQASILLLISLAVLLMCNILIGLELKLERLILFLPFVFLSMILNFLIYYCVSSLAFTMTEVWGVFFGTTQGILMLSGGIFPLDVFGENASKVLGILPFKYIVYYPVNIVNGRLSPDEILYGATVQMVWIIVMILLSGFCWKQGMKKYVAVGG